MKSFYCQNIYLEDGWSEKIRLTIDKAGTITAIERGAQLETDDVQLLGPVIPAMSNCHSHAFQRAFAGLSEFRSGTSDSFWSWRKLMYQFLATLGPDDCRIIAEQLYIEMLKAGYISVGEFHYLHHDVDGNQYLNPNEIAVQIIHAAENTGIKLTLLPVLYRYSGFGKNTPGAQQKRFILSTDNYIKQHNDLRQELTKYNFHLGFAPHSLRAVDIEDIHHLTDALSDIQFRHIHIAEQLSEVEQCIKYCSNRPVDYLFDNHSIDSRWSLIHATHITDQEVNRIKQSGAVIAICPSTEASLGDGIINNSVFDADHPTNWSIGSDSHISVDISEELRLLEYGLRLTQHQRALITSEQFISNGEMLWRDAVNGGHQSIGHGGQIRVGGQADWLVIDDQHPSIMGIKINYLFDALIFSNRGNNPVKDVYINGNAIIRNGRHKYETEILSGYRSLITRLMTRL